MAALHGRWRKSPVLSHAKDLAAAERGFLRGTSVATRIPTAECLLSEDLTWKFRTVFAPDEHYFGTVLAIHRYPKERINHLKSGTPAYFYGVDHSIIDELSNFPGFFPGSSNGNLILEAPA